MVVGGVTGMRIEECQVSPAEKGMDGFGMTYSELIYKTGEAGRLWKCSEDKTGHSEAELNVPDGVDLI